MKLDVAENGEGHEEDECCVEEDESGLGDVAVVWEVVSFHKVGKVERTRRRE